MILKFKQSRTRTGCHVHYKTKWLGQIYKNDSGKYVFNSSADGCFADELRQIADKLDQLNKEAE
jgi:hypothetical protein